MISFTVHGTPQPAGSKRAFPIMRNGRPGVAVSDDNPKSKDWKLQVAQAARAAYAGPLLDGPLQVSMVFVRPRPASHYGKKGPRASAPEWPTTRPDVLKLARAVEDSLTSVIWRDDAQIVREVLAKCWGESAQVEIVVQAAPPSFRRISEPEPGTELEPCP